MSDRNLMRQLLLLVMVFVLGLTGCALPQVSAEDRLFSQVYLEFLDAHEMPKQSFEDTTVGGLSAIAYDRSRDRFYALSDDKGDLAPPRFYTLRLSLDSQIPEETHIAAIDVERVTLLEAEDGQPFSNGLLDPEGMALSPRDSLFIASEGATHNEIPPRITEFDRETGEWLRDVPIPQRYSLGEETDSPQGVRDNRGFEALALSATGGGLGGVEPFRVFTALEEPLLQDPPVSPTAETEAGTFAPGRLMHYLVSDDQVTLLAEHLYPIEPKPFGSFNNGLTDLVVLDQAGHFLSLERSFGLLGAGAKLFQLAIADATDISQMPQLPADLRGIRPIYKRLVLDLSELEIPLDNLEGLAIGPQLPDGSQSLILVSDDNFNDGQITQWLLFRLNAA